jgi:Flp pilus assembly protein CpaB
MKNYVPLILAVILGFVAVVAVARLLREKEDAREATAIVVAAARDFEAGEVITNNGLAERVIPQTAKPATATSWKHRSFLVGQKTIRPIRTGDYVLLSDVAASRSLGTMIAEGEWALPVVPDNPGVVALLQPGDEVAVLATMAMTREEKSMDMSKPNQVLKENVTATLFPKVRVLAVAGQDATDSRRSTGTIVTLVLPAREAQALIAAQKLAAISLALRHPQDDTATDRNALGMVRPQTFARLLNKMSTVDFDNSSTGE